MSQRSTISFGKRFHLFRENADSESIYLELEDVSECSFELWKFPDDKSRSRAVIKIPIEFWKKMIEDWEENPNKKKVNKKDPKFD